jgi:hypothetical protein
MPQVEAAGLLLPLLLLPSAIPWGCCKPFWRMRLAWPVLHRHLALPPEQLHVPAPSLL